MDTGVVEQGGQEMQLPPQSIRLGALLPKMEGLQYDSLQCYIQLATHVPPSSRDMTKFTKNRQD